MFCSLIAGLALVRLEAHGNYSGPLKGLMADGALIAPVATGLPVTIAIGSGGSADASQQTDVTLPGGGTATVKFDGLAFGSGHLTGTVQVTDGNARAIEGVRLDFSHLAVKVNGKDVVASIAANSSLFGDLAKGEASAGIPFDETLGAAIPQGGGQVVAYLSGLAFDHRFEVQDMIAPFQIDDDGHGHLLIAGGNKVAKINEDGSGETAFVGVGEDTAFGVAVDRQSGMVFVTHGSEGAIHSLSASGQDQGFVQGTREQNVFLHLMRVGRDNLLYAAADGSNLYSFQGGLKEKIEKIGDVDINTSGFDAASDGSIWLVMEGGLYWRPKGGTAKLLAAAKDYHLGRTYTPLTVRVDDRGAAYVLDDGDTNDNTFEFPRAEVFDAQGRFLRVFGFGSKAPDRAANADGQIRYAIDLTFGSDGHLYVMHKVDSGNSDVFVTSFTPF